MSISNLNVVCSRQRYTRISQVIGHSLNSIVFSARSIYLSFFPAKFMGDNRGKNNDCGDSNVVDVGKNKAQKCHSATSKKSKRYFEYIPSSASCHSLFIFCSALIFSSHQASATENLPYYSCFKEASNRYNLDISLLYAIAEQESDFRVDAINHINEDSRALGIMQIWNKMWLPKLEEFGITETELLTNPCTNINVGAWVLAQKFHAGGVNLNSVGAYYAGFKEKNQDERYWYAQQVIPRIKKYKQILSERSDVRTR